MGRPIFSPLLSILISLLFSLLPIVFSEVGDSFIGCGGFVSVSQSLTRAASGNSAIDYSLIKINLYTKDGFLKQQTECAPNGYYFFPMYDTGSFDLRVEGPPGWSFATTSYPITINDGDQCNKGEDINFSVTGFALSGRINGGPNCYSLSSSSSSQPSGLEGITVRLSSSGPTQEQVTKTKQGQYSFQNLLPGHYKVRAEHPSWSFLVDSADVDIVWGNAEAPVALVVSGYDVRGRVTASGEGLGGVEVLLYSTSDREKEVARVNSGPDGNFEFGGVACGEYVVVPRYTKGSTRFDVVPNELVFDVLTGSYVFAEPFKVIGFSARGRVVDTQGRGISGVEVRVDGKSRAKTNKDGSYVLEGVEAGTYLVEAAKDDVFFSRLPDQKLSPSQPQISDLVATEYHLCGKVVVSQLPASTAHSPREVTLENLETHQKQTTKTSGAGEFCFKAKSGKYQVTPQFSSEELAGGLELRQSSRQLEVSFAPVLGIEFTQSLLTVFGRVHCLDAPCDTSISVRLSSSTPNRQTSPVTTGLGVSSPSEDYFVFRDVLPGKYVIKIEKEGWLWDKDQIEVDVRKTSAGQRTSGEEGRGDHVEVQFFQKGFVASCRSAFPVPFDVIVSPVVNGSDSAATIVRIVRGVNDVTLPKPGRYTIRPEACFKFEKDQYVYDTSLPRQIELVPTRFLVNGSVIIKNVQEPTTASSLSIRVEREDEEGATKVEKQELKCSGVKDGKEECQFTYWSPVARRLRFVPESESLLFQPRALDYVLDESTCLPPLKPFIAQTGIYLTGTVEPANPDTIIKAFTKDTKELVGQVNTKEDGSYSVGPLYSDQEYSLTAEKEGFKYVQKEEGTGFRGLALGKISVVIQDEATSELVQNVVVSLTGAESYRSNKPTSSDGTVSFTGLHPGQYFLRSFLKEYVFDPASKTISLTEGHNLTLQLSAKRTAFSCYGKVRFLNGEPEKFVSIEAISPSGDREEAQTDKNGEYRLRGLKPGQTYQVRLKQPLDTSRVERASPSSIELGQVNDHDFLEKNFVIFRRPSKIQITGTVNSSESALPTLTVELYQGEASDSPLKSVKIFPSNFFEFSSLNPKEAYFVRVSSSLSPKEYEFESPKIPVNVEAAVDSNLHLQLEFHAKQHVYTQETAAHSSYALFFGLVIAAIVIFRAQISEWIALKQTTLFKKMGVIEKEKPIRAQSLNFASPNTKKVTKRK